jgi:divalent metal cation (Fe/Co/Zn/Cd) transporter
VTEPDTTAFAGAGNADGDICCAPSATPVRPDAGWLRAARQARTLSWASLAWMSIEGAAGIGAGLVADSIALTGWALSSAVEALASVIVIWRFTGTRTLSGTAEARAQKGVAVSFWLLAPYVTVDAMHNLITGQHPATSLAGIVLTALAVVLMPTLGIAKRRLGHRLNSGATAGEGTQNLLCAYLAGAVLISLAANTLLNWWWFDPVVGLAVAAMAIREGIESWHGNGCQC